MKPTPTVIIICLIVFTMLLSGGLQAASVIEQVWKEKVEGSKDLLKESPDDIRLRFTLAVAYANLGTLDAASREMDALLELDGGKMARQIVKETEAVRKENPEDLLNLNYLAFAYFAINQHTRSRLIFEEILTFDPESVWTLNYYAIVLGNLEEYDLALKVLNQANHIQENKYTHFIISLAYFKQGKTVKGMWHLSKSGDVGLKLLK